MTGGLPADRINRDEIVALASRLISIPSTSGEERAVMEEVIRWCSASELPFGYWKRIPTVPTSSLLSETRPLDP
jgi:acetylornithine deacetylase/succinyl-diaminopimelate desuccinylase-like protein